MKRFGVLANPLDPAAPVPPRKGERAARVGMIDQIQIGAVEAGGPDARHGRTQIGGERQDVQRRGRPHAALFPGAASRLKTNWPVKPIASPSSAAKSTSEGNCTNRYSREKAISTASGMAK